MSKKNYAVKAAEFREYVVKHTAFVSFFYESEKREAVRMAEVAKRIAERRKE